MAVWPSLATSWNTPSSAKPGQRRHGGRLRHHHPGHPNHLVEGSLEWVTPNAVVDMTDAVGDDPGEFIEAEQMVRVRMGSGANGTQGGQLDNDPLGMDSVAYKYKVALFTDDRMLLQCDGTLTAEADIFGAGNISGNDQTNDGASALVDENGCPVEEVTVLEVQTGVCPPVSIEPTGTTCLGDDVALEVPQPGQQPPGAVSGQLHVVRPQWLCDGRSHGVHPRWVSRTPGRI